MGVRKTREKSCKTKSEGRVKKKACGGERKWERIGALNCEDNRMKGKERSEKKIRKRGRNEKKNIKETSEITKVKEEKLKEK